MLEEKKKKQPKHMLAIVQILVLKTSFPHKHTHTFLITYSILSSTHPLLTSFIHSTQLSNIHGVPSSEQNRQVSALTETTVWRRKQTLQQLPPSWGWEGGNSTKGGAVLFQEVMEIMPGEVIVKLRKERNGWRRLAPGRKNVPGWSWNNIWWDIQLGR